MAGAVLALAAVPQLEAQSRDPYGPTIQFGTGLINNPVAWVSPRSGDLWITTSGKNLPQDEANFATAWNTNLSAETHWLGRFTVGAAAYSQNPEWGFFGSALLLRDGQFGFLPAIAVGARNIGPYEKTERLLIAHDICLTGDTTGGGGGSYQECVDTARFNGFKTTPSLYAVATKDIALGSLMGSMSGGSMSFSVGMGNGLFSDDGDLGEAYNESGTIAKGLFLGMRMTMHPTLNTTLTFLAENDGWDYNVGLAGDWRGITLGIYGTELEEGSFEEGAFDNPYNYRKLNVLLSYSGNVIDISRGILLRARITELTREQDRLRIEIAQRQRRIAGLEVALRRAQAGELADIARRREELDREVQAEREAIRRAEERLRQIQQGQQTPPPPSTPPSITPPTP